MEKALVIRKHGSIGDMLMMTPALRELSNSFDIDVAVQENYKEVFMNLAYIKNIFSANQNIDYKSYDRIFDLSDFEFNYEQTFQPIIEKTKIDLFCDALNIKEYGNKIDIALTETEKKYAEEYFKKNNPLNKKVISFAIKSTNPTREWDLSKWKELVSNLKKLNYFLVVLDETCNWEDKEINFFNNRTIRELFAIVSKSDYIICNDSGLLHVAGAFEKKTLGIFGPTNPKLRCIYKNSYWICNNQDMPFDWYDRSNYKKFFDSIKVADVERKFLEILQDE